VIDPRILLYPVAAPGEGRQEVVRRARGRGFRRFVGTSVAPVGEEEWYRRSGSRYWSRAGQEAPVEEVTVRGPQELRAVQKRLGAGEQLAVRWKGERVIPLETLVASRGGAGKLWVVAERPEEVPGLLGALEHGADTVVVELRGVPELEALEALLDSAWVRPLDWQSARTEAVTPVGMGDRVIVDTTSLLAPDEGLFVGSAAAFLFHVVSETRGSRYTRPRPFRVNAGAAHSYVLLANGETRYLSELEPGDAILVARPRGAVRSVRVGRLKTERRPLKMLSASTPVGRCTVFVQEAETVRLTGPDGPVASTSLRPGMRLLGVRLPRGRHLGVVVEETIEER
jgi:3-dehydroquinate synthase II